MEHVQLTDTTAETANSIFVFQKRTLPVLMGWAAGSIIMGIYWIQQGPRWWQGFGSQFIGWGLIDGLIGAAGLRGAQKNIERHRAGEIDSHEHAKQVRTFARIVWLNAFLDLLYVLGGSLLIRDANGDERKRGIGWGIIIQGSFLLIWDIILGVLTEIRYDSK